MPKPQVAIEILFGKSDFAEYIETIPLDIAVATVLREAVNKDANDADIAEMVAKDPKIHAKDQERTVLAKRMDKAFVYDGTEYAAGHWIVESGGDISVLTGNKFALRFTAKVSKKAKVPTV